MKGIRRGLLIFLTLLIFFPGCAGDMANRKKRAEAKDYLDIDALLQNGIDLPNALAAGRVIYGLNFNPLISLKALSFFDDVPLLPTEVQKRLSSAVKDVDPSNLPALTPFIKRKDKKENRP